MANATESNINLINALLGVPSKIFGSTTTQTSSGGSSTQQTMISQAGVDALLKSLLEGTTGRAGLAAVASGGKRAGLYNSTTNSMLVNDLLARSAAEVEKARAPTVTTKEPSTTKTKVPGLLDSISPTGLLLGGALLAGGTKKGRDLISGLFGDGMSDSPISAATASSAMGGGLDTTEWGGALDKIDASRADVAAMFSQDFADFGAEGVASLAESFGGDAVMAGMAASDFADFGAAGVSSLAESAGLVDSIPAVGADGVPVLGPAMKLAQGDIGGAVGTGVGAMIGNAILPGVGGLIGGFLGGGGGCFITTAVCKDSGLPDDCYELTTLRNYRDTWLKEHHPESIEKYYAEAPAIVEKLSARADASHLFHLLNRDYIQPAIAAIEDGAMELAYMIYRNMFELAKELANG